MRFQVHDSCVGVEIGWVMLRVEPYQDVAQNSRAEKIPNRSEETLVQVVAQLFQTEHVCFDLLRGGFFVHLESAFPRRADCHCREAVIVTGNAGCLRNEIGIGPVNQGNTSRDGALEGVLAPWFDSGRAGRGALRPYLTNCSTTGVCRAALRCQAL
jgi:hypothetical protein